MTIEIDAAVSIEPISKVGDGRHDYMPTGNIAADRAMLIMPTD